VAVEPLVASRNSEAAAATTAEGLSSAWHNLAGSEAVLLTAAQRNAGSEAVLPVAVQRRADSGSEAVLPMVGQHKVDLTHVAVYSLDSGTAD